MSEDIGFVQSTYMAMQLMGIDPARFKANFELDDSDQIISIAIPDSKVAFASEADEIQDFIDQGWYVERIPLASFKLFHNIFTQFQSLFFEDMRRRMSDTIKQTSRHEDWLLQEIIRRSLPEPDRDFTLYRDNGKELTTPDFSWVDEKVAFFVDGLWWHITMDDSDKLDALTDPENRKDILNGRKTRAERDAVIRSTLSADGWVVLSCTDRQLEDSKGIREQVNQIEQVLKRIRAEKKILREALASSSTIDLVKENGTDEVKKFSLEDLL